MLDLTKKHRAISLLIALLLTLTLSASITGASPHKQDEVTIEDMGDGFMVQLLPEANLKAIVQRLLELQTFGQIDSFGPAGTLQLRIETSQNISAALNDLAGVANVIPLQAEQSEAETVRGAESAASSGQTYWLLLEPDVAQGNMSAWLDVLGQMKNADMIESYSLTDQIDVVQVVTVPESVSALQQLPGVWNVSAATDSEELVIAANERIARSIIPTATTTITPTATAVATDTPAPTETPVVEPTDMPAPTETSAVEPTDMPAPTETSIVEPTDMPAPTETSIVEPTDMPAPTETSVVEPTDMPAPTETSLPPTETPAIEPTDMPAPTETSLPPTETPAIEPTDEPTVLPPTPTVRPTGQISSISGIVTDEQTGVPLAGINVCAQSVWRWDDIIDMFPDGDPNHDQPGGDCGWDKPDGDCDGDKPDGDPNYDQPGGDCGLDKPDGDCDGDKPDGDPNHDQPGGDCGWDKPDGDCDGDKPDGDPNHDQPGGDCGLDKPDGDCDGDKPDGDPNYDQPGGDCGLDKPDGDCDGDKPDGDPNHDQPGGDCGWDKPDGDCDGDKPDGDPNHDQPSGDCGLDKPDGDCDGDKPDGDPNHDQPSGDCGLDKPDGDCDGDKPDGDPNHDQPGGDCGLGKPDGDCDGDKPDVDPNHDQPGGGCGLDKPDGDCDGDKPDVDPNHDQPSGDCGLDKPDGDCDGDKPDGDPNHDQPSGDCGLDKPDGDCDGDKPDGDPNYDSTDQGGNDGWDWSQPNCAVTDENGRYTIYDLEPKSYKLQFSDPQGNYLAEFYNNQTNWHDAETMTLVDEQTVTVDAALGKGGQLSGLVTNDQNEPLSDIWVEVYNLESKDWSDGCWIWVAATKTDTEGRYEVGGLSTGTYRVGFYDRHGNYFTEYYDNTSDLKDSTDVSVTTGQNTTGIDAVLGSGGHISGQVTNVSNEPLAEIMVLVKQKTKHHWEAIGWATTDEQGNYDVSGLMAGDYLVYFTDTPNVPWGDKENDNGHYLPEFYDDTQQPDQATLVTVGDGQSTDNINAVLTTGGQINGQVTTDGSGLAWVSVELFRQEEGQWEWIKATHTNKEGQYQLAGLSEGIYSVGFSGWLGHVGFKQFYQDAPDLNSATEIDVAQGQTIGGINAIISDEAGQISGMVTNQQGEALAEISVKVYWKFHGEWEKVARTETDSAGQYEIGGLPTGSYSVAFFDHSGAYMGEYYDDMTDPDQATLVTVTAGESTVNINAVLGQGGSISGQVSSSQDQPLAKVNVCAMPADRDETGNHDGHDDWGNCARTNEQGLYQITGLPSGDYVVSFESPYHHAKSEFYDNKGSWQEADAVSVSLGQTTSDINAVLSNGSAISGVVTDEATGEALPETWVCANPAERHGWQQCETTDENGAYTIGGLRTGSYIVEFWHGDGHYLPEFYDNQASPESANPVSVEADQTTTDINAALSTGGHISGQVTNNAGEPLADIAVEVYADGTTDMWGWRGMAHTDENGQYDIGGLAEGDYRVGFFDWTGRYVSEFYDNAFHLEAGTQVSVLSQQTTSDINAVLEIGGGLSGQITSDGSETLEGIEVIVYRSDNGEWVEVGHAKTNRNGNYMVKGLMTGAYRVEFVDWTERDSHQSERPSYANEFYQDAQSLDSATDVQVTAGTVTPNVDASLSIGGQVTGMVTGKNGHGLRNVTVEIFIQNGTEWEWAGVTRTNHDGFYKIGGLATGIYRLGFFDWSNQHAYGYYQDAADLASATDVQVTVGQTVEHIDMALGEAVTPLIEVGSKSGGVMYNPRTGEATIAQPIGHPSDVTISKTKLCENGEAVLLMNEAPYPLQEERGQYRVTIPAGNLVDGATLTLSTTCDGQTTTEQVGQVMLFLYDPSGIITDAQTQQPIEGATVTLYKVPGWSAKESASDNRENTCQSNLSKDANAAWSQAAPTSQGVVADPTLGEIDPVLNPFLTDENGYYGWDVAAGCWYVVVSATGYETKTSPVVGVPPEVTDLHVALTSVDAGSTEKTATKVYLPVITQ
ncbi:carboxypeptidase regulatory-like domain-containing protein [Anaerolineales bacterium HSG6]|nr:carboxypeptidase regulatory-like domain-containing protein [Anaerolineales bacterium HSG6]